MRSLYRQPYYNSYWGHEYEQRLQELLPIDFPESLPVYVISILDAGEKFRRDGTKAYTGPFCDLYLQKVLESFGRWRGRGFCTVVQRYNQKPDRVVDDILHEASHYFEFAEVLLLSPLEKFPQEYQDRFKNNQKKSANEFGTREPEYPWVGHDDNFIRSALHIAYRARLADFLTTIEMMEVAGSFYGLSSPQQYAEALQNEPWLFSTARIWDIIEKSNPPQEFTDLFESDVEAYVSGNRSVSLEREHMRNPQTATRSTHSKLREALRFGKYRLLVNSNFGFNLQLFGMRLCGVFVQEAARLVGRLSRQPVFSRLAELREPKQTPGLEYSKETLLDIDNLFMNNAHGIKGTDRSDFQTIIGMVCEAKTDGRKSEDVILSPEAMSTRIADLPILA